PAGELAYVTIEGVPRLREARVLDAAEQIVRRHLKRVCQAPQRIERRLSRPAFEMGDGAWRQPRPAAQVTLAPLAHLPCCPEALLEDIGWASFLCHGVLGMSNLTTFSESISIHDMYVMSQSTLARALSRGHGTPARRSWGNRPLRTGEGKPAQGQGG